MRILYVIDTLERGGAEKQLALIARRMKSAGHDVSVITLYAEGWWAEQLRAADVPVAFAGFPSWQTAWIRMWPAFCRLVRDIRSQRPDIVCGFLYYASTIAALAARRAGVKHVLSVRRDCGFIRERAPFPRWLEKLSHRASTLFVANSRAVAEALRVEGIAEGKIRVIYNGIEMDGGAPAPSRNTREFHVGMLANFTSPKDHATFVRAIGLAGARLPSLQAWIAGKDYGIRARSVEDEIRRLRLGERVTMLPYVENPREFISKLDVGVLCSTTEGFPNVVLEYMSQAKPVVASRVGGIPEIVKDGETGLLFEAGDASALARALVRLANDPALRERIGRAGLDTVVRECEIGRIAGQWRAVCEEAMGKAAPC
ncbi:MAG: glycosyltransferase [Nitrospirota bacterium]